MTKTEIFSADNSSLRVVWDATTLEAFMRDPLSYYWKYVQGYRSNTPSIDLLWGTAWDQVISLYHHERDKGRERSTVVRNIIEAAIDLAELMHLDEVAAESGNKARKKNLSTLIRSIVWYDDEHGDYDLYEPIIALPTTVQRYLNIHTPSGEQYVVVGNYDQVVRERESGKIMVVERKTTTSSISESYWLRYNPSVQINTYDWLANTQGNHSGVFIEACQTGVGFTRFAHHRVLRTPLQRVQWEKAIEFWILFAEHIAVNDSWTRAINLATQWWESATRRIQRTSPAVWDGLLATEMTRKAPWNPLEID